MHFLDGIDNAADDFFGVGGAKGTGGAVDGGLDYGVRVFDRVDEGGMGCGVALGDAQAGVIAKLGGQLGGVAKKGGDVMLLTEACCEGGRANSAWHRLVSMCFVASGAPTRTCSADDEDLHGCDYGRVQVMDMATKAINALGEGAANAMEAGVELGP